MNHSVLKQINFDKYPIKIICNELGKENKVYQLMLSRAYKHYEETRENIIFVKS